MVNFNSVGSKKRKLGLPQIMVAKQFLPMFLVLRDCQHGEEQRV